MTTTNQVDSVANEYFDLHITGLGYLNRPREVTTRGGSFVACDIAALHGSKDNVEYTRFDCIVRGTKAEQVVRDLMPAVEADKAVLIGFKLGDVTADTFEYPASSDKAGRTGISLKSRLLQVTWAKVDGKTVYSAKAEAESSSDEPADAVNAD